MRTVPHDPSTDYDGYSEEQLSDCGEWQSWRFGPTGEYDDNFARSAEEDAADAERDEILYQLISNLPERQADVILMKMGFTPSGAMTQEEIAEAMEVSQPAVCKLERKAIDNLRRMMDELPVARQVIQDFEIETGRMNPGFTYP